MSSYSDRSPDVDIQNDFSSLRNCCSHQLATFPSNLLRTGSIRPPHRLRRRHSEALLRCSSRRRPYHRLPQAEQRPGLQRLQAGHPCRHGKPQRPSQPFRQSSSRSPQSPSQSLASTTEPGQHRPIYPIKPARKFAFPQRCQRPLFRNLFHRSRRPVLHHEKGPNPRSGPGQRNARV